MSRRSAGKALSEWQQQLLVVRRERTISRLELIVAEARRADFTVGRRVSQPAEVRRLQRRVRGVTLRWAPMWTTEEAEHSDDVHVDHVVPVVVLTERLLLGDELESVLGQALLCRVTREEHRGCTGLEVAFRLKQADLYEQMLNCAISELGGVGWERYRSAGIEVAPVQQ